MRTGIRLLCSILLLSSSAIAAEGFGFEAFYANYTIFDAKNRNGAGGSLFFNMGGDFKAMLRGEYTFLDEKQVKYNNDFDVSYRYASLLAGIGYELPPRFTRRNRFVWRSSLLCGYSYTGTDINSRSTASAADSGFAMAINTGIGYNFSKNFQFFVEAGWQHSFYWGELKDSKIYGVQALAGVRYTMTHSGRPDDL